MYLKGLLGIILIHHIWDFENRLFFFLALLPQVCRCTENGLLWNIALPWKSFLYIRFRILKISHRNCVSSPISTQYIYGFSFNRPIRFSKRSEPLIMHKNQYWPLYSSVLQRSNGAFFSHIRFNQCPEPVICNKITRHSKPHGLDLLYQFLWTIK